MRKRRQLYHDSDHMTWPDFNFSRTPDGEVIYKDGVPYSAQHDFCTNKSKFLCAAGGFGGGKSNVLVRRSLALLINTPWFGDLAGNMGLIGRQSLKSFVETTLVEFWKVIPGGRKSPWIRKYHVKDGRIELVNESILQFTHYDEKEHLQSYNFGFAAIDQMEQIDWEVFKALGYERIRNKVLTRYYKNGIQIIPKFDQETADCISTDPEELSAWLRYQCVFGVCNPRRCWIYDKFVRNEYYNKLNTPETKRKYNPRYKLITLSTFDNKANLPSEYIEDQKKDKTIKDYRRSVLGAWDAFEGQIYEDFTDDLINEKNIMPHPVWDIYVGIDHGGSGTPDANYATNVTAVTFFALEERTNRWPKVHWFDELFLPGSTIEETVREIHKMLVDIREGYQYHYPTIMNLPNYVNRYMAIPKEWRCDPTMKRNIDNGEETFIEAYMRHASLRGFNMPLIPGGYGMRERQDMLNWLFRKKLVDVNPKCTNFIECFREYEYGKNEKPKLNQNDHPVNAAEYSVTAIPLWTNINKYKNNNKSIVDSVLEQARRNQLQEGFDPVYGNLLVNT